jgi:hypothetical protein
MTEFFTYQNLYNKTIYVTKHEIESRLLKVISTLQIDDEDKQVEKIFSQWIILNKARKIDEEEMIHLP